MLAGMMAGMLGGMLPRNQGRRAAVQRLACAAQSATQPARFGSTAKYCARHSAVQVSRRASQPASVPWRAGWARVAHGETSSASSTRAPAASGGLDRAGSGVDGDITAGQGRI